ncbi:hypothetical protein VA603_19065, partial [Stenotrophomonas sp. MH1]
PLQPALQGFAFLCKHLVFTFSCSDNFKKNFKFIKQVVDRFKKPAKVGGSLQQDAFGRRRSS